MALDTILKGTSSGNGAEVDSSNQVKVVSAIDDAAAGFSLLATELAAASEISAAKRTRRLRASFNSRLSVGMDNIAFQDSFQHTAQNTGRWRSATTTFVRAQTGGFVVLNSTSVTTASAAAVEQTWAQFPLRANGGIIVDVSWYISAALGANTQMEWGWSTANLASTPFTLADGAFFRLNSTGLFGILSYNTSETPSGTLLAAANIDPNTVYTTRMVVNTERTEFWITDSAAALGGTDGEFIYLGSVATPAGNALPNSTMTAPITFRMYHSGAAGAAVIFRVGAVAVTLQDTGDFDEDVLHGWQGLHASQGQNGGTMGSTALYTNSLAAGAGAAMTNTTAALGSGLGGQFTTQPTLAAGTDGILASYQVPAGSVTQEPKSLVLTGIRIQGAVTAALTGGPVLYAYSLAYGHNLVSMANAEGIAAKAPRRIPLGFESFAATAALGTIGQSVTVDFSEAPVVIAPGEFFAVCAKNLATVTSAGTITVLVTPIGHWL